MTRLEAYLEAEKWHYRHSVNMADAMADRGDTYGVGESMDYINKAFGILVHMQAVVADPDSYDLEVSE